MRRLDGTRGLVWYVHGVACFKPEKKAKWKHVKACSRSHKREVFCLFSVASHQSAAGSELEATRVTA